MSIAILELERKIHLRMEYLEKNCSSVLKPSFHERTLTAWLKFCRSTYEMAKNGTLNYLDWYNALSNFYLDESINSLDPDGTIEKLAKRFLGHPDLNRYYQVNVYNNGEEFDLFQIRMDIHHMERALGL